MALNDQRLRLATEIKLESRRMLHDQGVEIGSAVMSEKKVPGTVGSNGLVLTTNVYGLQTKKVFVYYYNVKIVGVTRTGILFDYTEGASTDAEKIERRGKCRDVVVWFNNQYPGLLDKQATYYDLQRILYSVRKLEFVTREVTYNVAMPPEFNHGIVNCMLTFKTVTENFELNIGDLSKASPNLDYTDQSLLQFLNLATSQHMMFRVTTSLFSSSTSYLLNPLNHGFREEDLPNFADNGSYLAVGAQKGVRYIEGPNGMGNTHVAVVIETKKTPFHQVQYVSDKARCVVRDLDRPVLNGDLIKLKNLLKGLRVDTVHGSNRSYTIENVSKESARQKGIVFDDQPLTVEQYFLHRYGIALTLPNAPLLECKVRGSKNYFPMEVCTVADNQRVKNLQQTPRQVQEMIRRCAVVPFVLREQSDRITDSLNLRQNEYLREASVKFIPNNLKVKARVLSSPTIEYLGESVSPRPDSLTWQAKKFLRPSGCRKWAAHMFCGYQRDALTRQELINFVEKFLTECQLRGMNMPHPYDIFLHQSTVENLRREIENARKSNCDFVLMIHPDNQDEMHHAMKYDERKFGVTTQGLKITTIRNVLMKGQPLTVQNIVQKTNIKLGGLNYTLPVRVSSITQEVLASETLFIGFGINHPAGGMGRSGEEQATIGHINGNGIGNGRNGHNGNGLNGNGQNGNGHNGNGHHGNGHNSGGSSSSEIVGHNPVSVIGFSANFASDKLEFIGDFVYQKANRDEKATVIQEIVRRCVTTYISKRESMPKRVIIYRNGCSEGQYANILKYEVPLVKSCLESLSCSANVTLIVCNKLQNVRFFPLQIDPNARAPDQNIRPATVIDSAVVHPCYTEFFLNSHRAIQGTARTPKYTVLYDDNQLTSDQLQGVTHHLCFGHQIVCLPTSLPSPVYIANRYSERGKNMHAYHLKSGLANDHQTYRELTEKLAYDNTIFADVRLNA